MRRQTSFFGYCLGSVVLALVLSGCPGGGRLEQPECWVTNCEQATDGAALPFCDPIPIFTAECATSLCHGGGSPGDPPPGGADLFSTSDPVALGQALLGQAATYPYLPPAECPTATPELLINAADPALSLILTKVQGTHVCGELMPPGTVPLPASQVLCIEQWVQFTAANGSAGN